LMKQQQQQEGGLLLCPCCRRNFIMDPFWSAPCARNTMTEHSYENVIFYSITMWMLLPYITIPVTLQENTLESSWTPFAQKSQVPSNQIRERETSKMRPSQYTVTRSILICWSNIHIVRSKLYLFYWEWGPHPPLCHDETTKLTLEREQREHILIPLRLSHTPSTQPWSYV
jgi:hypothetical protein